MTRKSSISIILVLVGIATALAAAPATASVYEGGSVTALSASNSGDEQLSAPQAPYIGSVTALAGGHDGNSQPSGQPTGQQVKSSPSSDFQPLNGVLGQDGVAQPVPTASVADGDGFHWTDALIGALISSALLLMAYFTAREVARRRTSTAESRA